MTAYLTAGAVAVVVAVIGGLATDVGTWYRNLPKPSWTPPDWLFAPAWTVIYALTAWAAGNAWLQVGERERLTLVLAPFLLNAVLNAAWSVLFFRCKRPDWAFYEVIALWLSTLTLIVVLAPRAPFSAQLLVPYLLWVTFAGSLNLAIVRRNAAPNG